MDSRERALSAISRQAPDRIPIDFWASSGFLSKLRAETGMSRQDFADLHGVDFAYIAGPRYVGPPPGVGLRGEPLDIWGVPRTVAEVKLGDGVERYSEVTDPPLARATTVDEVLGYTRWPSPDWFDYSVVKPQCEQALAAKRAVVFMGDRLNRIAQLKPAMYLRGVDQIFVDMASAPEIAHAVLSRIREFYLVYLQRILEAADGQVDIVLTGDDFGAQDGLLLSPAMWDEFLWEGFAAYLNLAKCFGARTMHHTCGSVRPLVPRMIASGLDILQSVQPEAREMEPAILKQEFGARLAFHGGVSIQRTMPFGRREDIHGEVRGLAETLGKGGGYVFCTAHNIQADTPVENVSELMAAYHRYGRY